MYLHLQAEALTQNFLLLSSLWRNVTASLARSTPHTTPLKIEQMWKLSKKTVNTGKKVILH